MEAHTHSKGFHQEVMAMSYSNRSIDGIISSYENPEILQLFVAYLKKHHVFLKNENEKIFLLLNTVDNLCHELLYKEHPIIHKEEYMNECAHMLEALLTH